MGTLSYYIVGELSRKDRAPATTDKAKIGLIMAEIGHENIQIDSIQRLEKPQSGPSPRPRPIKVQLKDGMERGNIFRNTKQLITSGEQLAKVMSKRTPTLGYTKNSDALKK